MDKNTFFSDKNTDLIYTICRDEIQKKTQYNNLIVSTADLLKMIKGDKEDE